MVLKERKVASASTKPRLRRTRQGGIFRAPHHEPSVYPLTSAITSTAQQLSQRDQVASDALEWLPVQSEGALRAEIADRKEIQSGVSSGGVPYLSERRALSPVLHILVDRFS